MEGLIPMFYRAMKKNRIRSQYSVLSPDVAPASQSNYNIADFYVNPPPCHGYPKASSAAPDLGPRGGGGGGAHRRYNSFGAFSAEEPNTGHAPPPQQLVRFRSQRILSCLTGH